MNKMINFSNPKKYEIVVREEWLKGHNPQKHKDFGCYVAWSDLNLQGKKLILLEKYGECIGGEWDEVKNPSKGKFNIIHDPLWAEARWWG